MAAATSNGNFLTAVRTELLKPASAFAREIGVEILNSKPHDCEFTTLVLEASPMLILRFTRKVCELNVVYVEARRKTPAKG